MQVSFIKEIAFKIDKLVSEQYDKLAFYNLKIVKSVYTRLKDRFPVLDRSNVIYKIPCTYGKSYIGQTKQKLRDRIKQHQYDCKNTNTLKENKTTLVSHHFDTEHNFLFHDASILDSESNYFKCKLSKMVFIKLNNTVNLTSDTQNLSLVYNDILNFKK